MSPAKPASWQLRLHEIIYESGTKAGKAFDIGLLCLILSSIVVVMLDSSLYWHEMYGGLFLKMEWVFTLFFTIEYFLRLICITKPLRYVFSFFGLIDLLAIIPGYLSIFFAGSQSLLVLRSLRLMRIFRIFKLSHFLSEMQFLGGAIRGSLKKIGIFMLAVFVLVIILGSAMYLIEGGQHGFNSIPDSIYWAIGTISTVGVGIAPVTSLGKFIAGAIMLMGYAIIAVPTGILTTEMALAMKKKKQQQKACSACGREGHDDNASYCKFCGEKL